MPVVDAVRIEEQLDVAMAWIAARRGVDTAMLDAAAGMAMPAARRWSASDGVAMIAIGPGMWLAQRRDAPSAWGSGLEQRLAGLASVSDQTGAYRLFRVEGPSARTLLQRGVAIDLHDEPFPAGSTAATVIAHIDVILSRVEADAYEVAVYRSFADSFLRWLDHGLAGIG